TVLDYVYYGPDTVVTLSVDEPARTIVKARTSDQRAPAPGEAVELAVAGPVVVFPAQAADPRLEPLGQIGRPLAGDLQIQAT
ncbi:MAG TPA: TOBE domain-containing protein, partial [Solirubrobacteraceae bacterium]|nr:TOBE domain-containing protein [Solirubrobacteraceae bacterium]